MTKGNSIVNDTINYTTQPSLNPDGTRIPGATLSIPLTDKVDQYRTHRFDCHVKHGIKYYLDNTIVHTEDHNVPTAGGSLQLKLWADGNKWWSGEPSRTDAHLKVKTILAYYNTSTSLTDKTWADRCSREWRQCVVDPSSSLHNADKNKSSRGRGGEKRTSRHGISRKRDLSLASSIGSRLEPSIAIVGSMLVATALVGVL